MADLKDDPVIVDAAGAIDAAKPADEKKDKPKNTDPKVCECGAMSTIGGYARHKKTKKHADALEQLGLTAKPPVKMVACACCGDDMPLDDYRNVHRITLAHLDKADALLLTDSKKK